jgi:hypothetical protein
VATPLAFISVERDNAPDDDALIIHGKLANATNSGHLEIVFFLASLYYGSI